MNYVDHFNLFGVDAKQIACDTGKGAPTTSTVGPVGGFRMDTDTGDVYKCVAAVDGVYTWKNMGVGTVRTMIDLDTYGGGTNQTSLSHMLLDLIFSGGGSMQGVELGTLFDDLVTDRPLSVKFSGNGTDISEEMVFIVDGVRTMGIGDSPLMLGFDGFIEISGVLNVIYATITITGDITVTVVHPTESQGSSGSTDAVLYTPQDLTEEQKAQARENIGAETMITMDPSDYGIDMITALMNAMNGQIFTEIDCSAFINDVTAVFAKGNMLLISVSAMDVYGFINAFAPGYQIVASLAGRYSNTFIKADVMIFPEGIYMFANQLGVSGD